MLQPSNSLSPGVTNSTRLLALTCIYYLLCGASAIFWPQSWYWACGIVIPGGDVLLATIGALMLSLAYASWKAINRPDLQPIVLRTLLVANIADLLTVVFALYRNQLPIFNAVTFIGVAAGWCYFINLRLSRLEDSAR